MNHLDDILQNVDRIPPFSEVAQKAMSLLEDPNVTAKDLSGVIQYDQALTAGVLKTCNSPYYGLQRKVASVSDAVVVIGHNTLKDVILTCSAVPYYKGEAGAGYGHEAGDLWKHSVAAAIMAKLLMKFFPGVDAGKAYTTALMHDVGKLVLSNFVRDEFTQIMHKVEDGTYSFSEAEQEILGATHAEIGAKIMEKWAFPPDMVLAVKQHHDLDVLMKDPLSAVVSLSNIFVVLAGIGSGIGGMATKIKGEGLKRFGIKSGNLDLLMAELHVEVTKAQEIFELV